MDALKKSLATAEGGREKKHDGPSQAAACSEEGGKGEPFYSEAKGWVAKGKVSHRPFRLPVGTTDDLETYRMRPPSMGANSRTDGPSFPSGLGPLLCHR